MKQVKIANRTYNFGNEILRVRYETEKHQIVITTETNILIISEDGSTSLIGHYNTFHTSITTISNGDNYYILHNSEVFEILEDGTIFTPNSIFITVRIDNFINHISITNYEKIEQELSDTEFQYLYKKINKRELASKLNQFKKSYHNQLIYHGYLVNLFDMEDKFPDEIYNKHISVLTKESLTNIEYIDLLIQYALLESPEFIRYLCNKYCMTFEKFGTIYYLEQPDFKKYIYEMNLPDIKIKFNNETDNILDEQNNLKFTRKFHQVAEKKEIYHYTIMCYNEDFTKKQYVIKEINLLPHVNDNLISGKNVHLKNDGFLINFDCNVLIDLRKKQVYYAKDIDYKYDIIRVKEA